MWNSWAPMKVRFFFLVFCLGSNSERILTLNSLKMSGYNFGEYMISMER